MPKKRYRPLTSWDDCKYTSGKKKSTRAKKASGWKFLNRRTKPQKKTYQSITDTYLIEEVGGVELFVLDDEMREFAYMPDNGCERTDFARLFQVFGVRLFLWDILFAKVEKHFPDQYFNIITDPDQWIGIESYFEEIKYVQ